MIKYWFSLTGCRIWGFDALEMQLTSSAKVSRLRLWRREDVSRKNSYIGDTLRGARVPIQSTIPECKVCTTGKMAWAVDTMNLSRGRRGIRTVMVNNIRTHTSTGQDGYMSIYTRAAGTERRRRARSLAHFRCPSRSSWHRVFGNQGLARASLAFDTKWAKVCFAFPLNRSCQAAAILFLQTYSSKLACVTLFHPL